MARTFSFFLMLFLAFTTTSSIAQAGARDFVSPEWSQIVAAARTEGKVVLYSNAVPAVNDRLKAEFEKFHPGIGMEVLRLVGSQLTTKLQQERQSNADGADAVFTSEISWATEAAKGGLLKAPSGPSGRSWPANYLIAKTSPVLGVQPFPIIYNTNLVKTPVTGYQDLLKPEFKGKLGNTELAGSVSVIAWYDWLDKTQGDDFLRKLAAQGRFLYLGSTPATQAVSSGEVAIASFSALSSVLPLVEQGAPIRAVVPSPSFGNYYASGVPIWSKRPNAALVLTDFLMSMRGQTLLCGKGEMACPLAGVPGSLEIKSVILFDPDKYTPEVIKAFEAKWNRIFKER